MKVGHRDNATYNWPCENTGFGRYTPTCSIVCPCDLLIVIANATWTGNYRLDNVKGNSDSVNVRFILGITTVWSLCVPLRMVHSRIL